MAYYCDHLTDGLPDCGKISENQREGGPCATHAHQARKAERMASRPQKIYTIPKVAPKEAKRLKTYTKLRAEHLEKYPQCQIRLIGCLGKATEIHHSGKRGKNLLNSALFLSACSNCHYEIENVLSAKERREKGFLK